jgi:regulator of sirC expression with transglutaminase-like and TPR domain
MTLTQEQITLINMTDAANNTIQQLYDKMNELVKPIRDQIYELQDSIRNAEDMLGKTLLPDGHFSESHHEYANLSTGLFMLTKDGTSVIVNRLNVIDAR